MITFDHGAARHLKKFTCSEKAIDYLCQLYTESCQRMDQAYYALAKGDETVDFNQNDACYPYLGVDVDFEALEDVDSSLAFGMVDSPGSYGTTVTQPALFKDYYREQLALLQNNHGCDILVGESDCPNLSLLAM